MEQEGGLKKRKRVDPELLANLELLREMEKLEMIRDLHLQDDLDQVGPLPPAVDSKKGN